MTDIKRKSLSGDANGSTEDAKKTEAGVAYPYMLKAIWAFIILGTLGHFPFHVFGGGAKKLLKEGTARIIFAQCVPAVVLKATSPVFIQRIPNHIRMITAGVLGVLSMVCPVIAYSLDEASEKESTGEGEFVLFFGAALSAVAAAFGEVTVLAKAAPFPKKIVNSFCAGNGFAGLLGALWILFFVKVAWPGSVKGAPFGAIFVAPFAVIYPIIYFYMVPPVPETTDDDTVTVTTTDVEMTEAGAGASTDMAKKGDTAQQSDTVSFLRRVFVLWPFMLPLMCTYMCTYTMALGILTAYPGKHYKNVDLYVLVYMMQRIGIFVGRATTEWVHCTKQWQLWLFPLAQVVALIFQIFNALFNFLPEPVLYPLFLWHGLVGGAVYSNTMVIAKRDIPKEESPFALGVIATAYDLGRCLAAAGGTSLQKVFENHWISKISPRQN